MNLNIKELYGNKLVAHDGEIGQAKDFYFDDKTWVIRYLVADTGSWLTGRLVLLSPHSFGYLDRKGKMLNINLTKKQIENSPSIDSQKPVSRQYEVEYYNYYNWPAYWDGSAMWGYGDFPVVLPPPKEDMKTYQKFIHRDDKHLQSARAVAGYHIEAQDGEIGTVSGFMANNDSWAIRDLIVETGHWYSGKEIQISTEKVERISYEESKVFVNLTKAEIQQTAENCVVVAGT
jgi:hypothetical protein